MASSTAPPPRVLSGVGEMEMVAAIRELRSGVEDTLDAAGWPWSPALSRFLDSLVFLEERMSARRGEPWARPMAPSW